MDHYLNKPKYKISRTAVIATKIKEIKNILYLYNKLNQNSILHYISPIYKVKYFKKYYLFLALFK